MRARRLNSTSAFCGGSAAAVALLAFLCAPANASSIEPQCGQRNAERPASLEVSTSELGARLTESEILQRSTGESSEASIPGDRVPPSPEFQAIMTRILNGTAADAADDDGGADDTDTSPVAEVDTSSDAADPGQPEAGLASDSARLPGLSDAASERYRRQMYRTDI